MASKRVESGRGRPPGVVKKAAKQPNRGFYLLIAVVAVAGIGALTYIATKPSSSTASPIDTTLAPVQSNGYVMGNPNARVEVIEFGDFECPVCSQWAVAQEPDVRKRLVNTGTIRFRFIDYPLPMHANTWNASRAAACADEQGHFWEFHDALFQTQDQWQGETTRNPDKFFKQLAQQMGLNTSQFNACVDSKKYQAKIQAHERLAQASQVNHTPTFFVNNQPPAHWIPGFDDERSPGVTSDIVKEMVDSALKSMPPIADSATPTKAGKAKSSKKP